MAIASYEIINFPYLLIYIMLEQPLIHVYSGKICIIYY